MSLKFFNIDESHSRYLVEWDSGYVLIRNEWTQLKNPKEWNWLSFTPFSLNLELDRMCDDHFSIELIVLGFGFYFQQLVRETKTGRKLRKETMKIQSMEKTHQEEVKKLKSKIKVLKDENRRLNL